MNSTPEATDIQVRPNRKHQFEQQKEKPTPLPVKPDGIPASMKARAQWVVWRYQWKEKKGGIGKWDKPPFQVNRPEFGADTTDPSTWATFNEAMAEYLRGGWDGIGYVLAGDEVGTDLDDVRDPVTGIVEPWAVEIVNLIGSYAEISPSATGIKIIAKGTVARGRKFTQNDAEMYCKGRYFTTTGHVISERSALEDRQAEINAVYKTLDERNEAAKRAKNEAAMRAKSPFKLRVPSTPSANLTDEDLISKASAAAGDAGKKFRDFFGGDISGYPSQSEADLAFCNLIVFWTDDADQVRRIVQASEMDRDKWDRDDYAERTITLAFQGRRNRYDPAHYCSGQTSRERDGKQSDGNDGHGDAWEGESPDPGYSYDHEAAPPDAPAEDIAPKVITYTLGDLVTAFPQNREPVIHGLLRLGETMNVIASPKMGKSWLVAFLAFAVATGRDWLGFNTVAGDVLIVDNELHPETLASRLRRVAEANNIAIADIAEHVTIAPLRGRLANLYALGAFFRELIPGRFRLVVIDAYYRTLPIGTDENDNGAVAGLYNLIDTYADHLRCSFVLIHHASKGDQSQKRVTDVGSGAGSQSRAADAHLILRAHSEADAVVLDAAVRSFPPVSPRCLRWRFPSFIPADELDPAELRQTGRGRRTKADTEPKEPETPSEPIWDAKRFAETFGTAEPKLRSILLDDARVQKLSDRKAEMLLKSAIDRDYLYVHKDGAKVRIANVPPSRRKTTAETSSEGEKMTSGARTLPPTPPRQCGNARRGRGMRVGAWDNESKRNHENAPTPLGAA